MTLFGYLRYYFVNSNNLIIDDLHLGNGKKDRVDITGFKIHLYGCGNKSKYLNFDSFIDYDDTNIDHLISEMKKHIPHFNNNGHEYYFKKEYADLLNVIEYKLKHYPKGTYADIRSPNSKLGVSLCASFRII